MIDERFTIKKLKMAVENMSGAMFLDEDERQAWNYIAEFVEVIIAAMEHMEDDLK